MHDLAKLAMRGPWQAAIMASVSVMIPMMFWFGAAIVGLVTLRLGLSRGLSVFIWASIPALAWWSAMQDPGALVVLISVLSMAAVLRTTVSWQATLAVGGVISLLVGIVAPVLMPELIDTLMSLTEEFFKRLAEESQQEFDEQIQESFKMLLVASFASSFFGMAVMSLFLARHWQAGLYNPGGWREEFHQIRLSSRMVFGLILLIVIVPMMGINPALVFAVAAVPIMVCGFALVHGVIAKRKLGGQWLFGVYFSAILLFPTVLMLIALLALIDSLVDFRARIQSPEDR